MILCFGATFAFGSVPGCAGYLKLDSIVMYACMNAKLRLMNMKTLNDVEIEHEDQPNPSLE